MKTRVFVQSDLLAEIVILEVAHGTTGDSLKNEILKIIPGEVNHKELFVFLEDDDDDDPLSKLESVTEGLRLHVHRQKGIEVTVRYGGNDVKRTLRPSATIARVKRWATHDLGISASDAAELMLQVSGTTSRPDSDVHIGTLVHAPARTLQFDLVPSPRING